METKEARAYLKYARISPRKVCIVLDLIRGKKVDYAMGFSKTLRSGKRVSDQAAQEPR